MNIEVKGYTFPIGVVSKKRKYRIVPIFLPFEGCPYRCVFCAQDKQTGVTHRSKRISLSDKLANLFDLLKKQKNEKSYEDCITELAFYGGTFTLLDSKDLQLCLDMVRHCYVEGLISQARCSTRPDALDVRILAKLKDAGVQLIELGVQSFSDNALGLSQRGYTQKIVTDGCQQIVDAGLEFGIQLLPGMPGSTPENFYTDVQYAISLKPKCLRFYPCLVVAGTALAIHWQKGLYQPWDISTTVKALGKALSRAWSEYVPVIRLSLAPEEVLDRAVLAGPRHPALGSMVQGEALVYTVQKKIRTVGRQLSTVSLPSFCKGFFYGHAGTLKERWKSIGITSSNVEWSNHEYGELFFI